MGMREGMKVLDVGCGVGGPAREIVKFTGANVLGLNNNDYQIARGNQYAAKEGLSSKLAFAKGDFMVCGPPFFAHTKIQTSSILRPILQKARNLMFLVANVIS